MKSLICKNCGSAELNLIKGYLVCGYCESKYLPTKEETKAFSPAATTAATAVISLSDDVQRLLEKCKNEPKNARKYANLILDIDPDNAEALKYL